MKRTLFFYAFIFAAFVHVRAQTLTVQFYVDGNSNCQYDSGEQLIYNIQGAIALSYLNTSNVVSVTGNSVLSCAETLTLTNPHSSGSNTLTLYTFSNSYTGVQASTLCLSSWQNLALNAVNFVPVIVTSSQGLPYCGSPFFKGDPNAGPIPICSTIGNDSLYFGLSVMNIYSCVGGSSSRTYSCYIDGNLYDQCTINGAPPTWNSVTGTSNFVKIFESHSSMGTNATVHTKIPSAYTTLGTHTLQIVSSVIYSNTPAAISFSCVLNVIPCTQVTGKLFNDCNNNCTPESSDGAMYNGWVLATAPSYTTYAGPNSLGYYSLSLPVNAVYTLTPGAPSGVTVCPAQTTTVTGAGTYTVDFGFQSASHQDPALSLWRTNSGNTNAGGNINYMVSTSNSAFYSCSGTLSIPGKIKVKLPASVSFAGASTAPTVVTTSTGDTLIWNVANFYSYTSHQFTVTVASNLATLTPIPVSATIFPAVDNNTLNNTCTQTSTVGVPYDPNSKHFEAPGMAPDGTFPFSPTVKYTIHFQNIGTGPAINVKTLDTLDVNLEISSVKVISSSFPVQLQIDHVSRLMGFYFNNINLAGAYDEPNSHGYVQYQVNIKPSINYNTVIRNRAHNYFDHMPAIATNQTANKLVNMTGIDERIARKNEVMLLPNPVSDVLTVTSATPVSFVTVYDLSGRELISSDHTQIDLRALNEGVYFVRVSLANGETVTAKVIRN